MVLESDKLQEIYPTKKLLSRKMKHFMFLLLLANTYFRLRLTLYKGVFSLYIQRSWLSRAWAINY